MQTRGAGVLAGGLVAGLLAVPAAAAPTRWLTIRADRSAATTVSVPRGVTLLLGQPGDAGPVVSIAGGGADAGFLLTPVRGGGESVGQLALAAPPGGPAGPVRYSLGDERQPLVPGAYTLRVVAAAPVVIRVPVVGMSATWRPTRPVRTRRGRAQWDVSAGPVLLGGTPVKAGRATVALLAVAYDAVGTAGEARVCLTTPDGLCQENEGAWSATAGYARAGAAVRGPAGFAAVAEGVVGGAYTARWRVTTTGAALLPEAFAFVID